MSKENARGSLAQSALIGLYRCLHGDALRRTRLGRKLFEWVYTLYKVKIEAGPIERLAAYIRPDTWVIDVGANIGVFSLVFAGRVTGGRVIAIEPEQVNFNALERRAQAAGLHNKIVMHRAAAAEHAGVLKLAISPDHPGDHHLASEGVPIEVVTLDDLVRKHAVRAVSLIKIDVQGAELRVLKGAEELLLRDRPALFVEIDDAALQRQGDSAVLLFDWLEQRRYLPYRLEPSGAAPVTAHELLKDSCYTDALFLFQP